MPHDPLFAACETFLKNLAAAFTSKGDRVNVWKDIVMNGRPYKGLHLVWDGSDRIVVFAFCWDSDSLRNTRQDFLLFESACIFAGIYKKFHLVLFHDPELGTVTQELPTGISVTSIGLLPEQRESLPDWAAAKLGSIFFQDRESALAASAHPPDWRAFLTPEKVNTYIRELARNQNRRLPARFEAYTAALLQAATEDPARARELIRERLEQFWEDGQC